MARTLIHPDEILAAKRNMTADTALRLGRYFGTFWLNLQAAYEPDAARAAFTLDARGAAARP